MEVRGMCRRCADCAWWSGGILGSDKCEHSESWYDGEQTGPDDGCGLFAPSEAANARQAARDALEKYKEER